MGRVQRFPFSIQYLSIIDIFVYLTSKTNLRLRLNVLWVLSDNSVGLSTLFIHSFITGRYQFETLKGGQHQHNIMNQTLSIMKCQRTNICEANINAYGNVTTIETQENENYLDYINYWVSNIPQLKHFN